MPKEVTLELLYILMKKNAKDPILVRAFLNLLDELLSGEKNSCYYYGFKINQIFQRKIKREAKTLKAY